tara:strand:- start:18 stop:215 length:198 start_codon:yes stop_codon:yes gene_type:complete
MNENKKPSKEIVEEKHLHNHNRTKVVSQKSIRLALALRDNLRKRKYQKKLRAVILKNPDNSNLVE